MTSKKVKLVREAIETIFEKSENLEKLCWLAEQEHIGWEKWLQVELAFELSKHADVELEGSYRLDDLVPLPKQKVNFSNSFLDIVFRKKNDLKEKLNAVEIKMRRNAQGLKGVLMDLAKISAFEKAGWPFRSVTCVLVVDASTSNAAGKFAKIKNEIIEQKDIISRGGYDFLVFGWETNQTKRMERDSFDDWYIHLNNIFAKYGYIQKLITK